MRDGVGFRCVTDKAMAEQKMIRRVPSVVPCFLFLSAALDGPDLMAMVPSRLVQITPWLLAIDPPLELPGFEMLMRWPDRIHRDPAHQWLRDQIAGST
jgi:DNA-binding transcriptional LysR family regulator